MKKLIALLLILSIALTLWGCKKKEEPINADGQPTEQVSEESNSTPDETESSENKEPEKEEKKDDKSENEDKNKNEEQPKADDKPNLATLVGRKSSEISWKTVNFKINENNITFSFNVPSDWEFKDSTGHTYNIIRGGQTIGQVSTSKFASPKETLDKTTKTLSNKNATLSKQISLHSISGKKEYYYSYAFENGSLTNDYGLYLRVKYVELDSAAATTIYDSGASLDPFVNYEFPSISSTNGAKKVLILGNSFVNSSRISSFLDSMFSKKGYTAAPVGISMASVATFVNETEILGHIRNGDFSYVFQCGYFNSASILESLEVIKSACDASNTKLVVFPAHNEHTLAIEIAKSRYPDAIFLDWKGEIDGLIKKGVPDEEFCENDDVRHSKALAGYVGAHMIYRNMFGELPPDISGCTLTQAQVDALLGNYSDTLTKGKNPARPTLSGEVYGIN